MDKYYALISPETQVLLQNKAYRREVQSEYLVILSNPHRFQVIYNNNCDRICEKGSYSLLNFQIHLVTTQCVQPIDVKLAKGLS